MKLQPAPQRVPTVSTWARVGHILEPLARSVPVEDVLSEISHEEVDPAVVVVVSGTDARCPADTLQPDTAGHVLEGAVVAVAVETTARCRVTRPDLFLPRIGLEAGAAQDESVHPPVAVEVHERGSAAIRFDDEALAVGFAVNAGMGQAGLFRDVGKAHRPRRRGCLRARDGQHGDATNGRRRPVHGVRDPVRRSAMSNSRLASSVRPIC